MIEDIKKFYEPNQGAFYKKDNGEKGRRAIDNEYDKTRIDKADEQSNLPKVHINDVILHVNEFLESVKLENGFKPQTIQVKKIKLDEVDQDILGNAIIAVNCQWKDCKYDKIVKKYTFYDPKYDIIKDEFDLSSPNDIIWLKFTTDGYLGVVACSFDINFNEDTSSGKAVVHVGKKWDDTLAVIFPLTKEILGKRSKEDTETAVGEYLISKGVPIIDYYSHNY